MKGIVSIKRLEKFRNAAGGILKKKDLSIQLAKISKRRWGKETRPTMADAEGEGVPLSEDE